MRAIILMMLLLLTSMGFSQEKVSTSPRTELSVLINPLISWMQSDIRDVKYGSPRVGIEGGLSLDRFFAERYAINTGITIGTYGGTLNYAKNIAFKSESIPVKAGSDVTYKLQYVSIPLGIKLKTKKLGYFAFYAQMGLFAQFNIKATAKSSDNALQDDDIGSDIKLLNTGYQFGLGTEYDLGGSMAAIIGISMSNGIVDVTQNPLDKINLSNVALKLGILF